MSDPSWGTPQVHTRQSGIADDIDYEIKGQELQFVEIELDPGESTVAEAGAMVWKDASGRLRQPEVQRAKLSHLLEGRARSNRLVIGAAMRDNHLGP